MSSPSSPSATILSNKWRTSANHEYSLCWQARRCICSFDLHFKRNLCVSHCCTLGAAAARLFESEYEVISTYDHKGHEGCSFVRGVSFNFTFCDSLDKNVISHHIVGGVSVPQHSFTGFYPWVHGGLGQTRPPLIGGFRFCLSWQNNVRNILLKYSSRINNLRLVWSGIN